MATRSIIIGTVFNPFIFRYWLENFKKWQDKVDAVYICLDREHRPETEGYLKKEIAKFPKVHIFQIVCGWPHNMELAIKNTKEDLVLVIHDDTYIYNPKILDKYFDMAEKGIVVTPLFVHYSPTDLIYELVTKKYPFMPWRVGNYTSCSFLLYFLFCSRENYLKTDIDFSNNLWIEGEYIKELDYKSTGRIGGDTGLKFGFQLLYNNIQVFPIQANNLVDIPHKQEPLKEFETMVNSGLDWLHLQNISNTIPLWFTDEKEWYSGKDVERQIHQMNIYKDNQGVLEGMALRMAWLDEFLSVDKFEEISGFRDYMISESQYIIEYMNIDRNKIKEYSEVIKRL